MISVRRASDGGWRPGRGWQAGRPGDCQSRCGIRKRRTPRNGPEPSAHRRRREIERGLAGCPDAVSRVSHVLPAFVLIRRWLHDHGIDCHGLDPVIGAENKLDHAVRRPLGHDARGDKRRQNKGQKPRPERTQAHMPIKSPPHWPTLRRGQFRNNDRDGRDADLGQPGGRQWIFLVSRDAIRMAATRRDSTVASWYRSRCRHPEVTEAALSVCWTPVRDGRYVDGRGNRPLGHLWSDALFGAGVILPDFVTAAMQSWFVIRDATQHRGRG